MKNVKISHFIASEITSTLLKEIDLFLHAIDPTLPDNHFKKHHLHHKNLEVYVVRCQEQICGLVSFSATTAVHPLTEKKTFVSFGGINYRHPDSPLKNQTKHVSILHMRNHQGRFWFLKPFVAIAKTVNPRVFVQFNNFFQKTHPSIVSSHNKKWQHFLSSHLTDVEGQQVLLNDNLIEIDNTNYPDKTDVTLQYETYYSTHDLRINNYFLDHGVFLKEGSKYYLTNKSAVIVGDYRPFSQFKTFLFGKN